jgi:hypothetical protein
MDPPETAAVAVTPLATTVLSVAPVGQIFVGELLFLGVGVPTEKSVLLVLLSVQPVDARIRAVAFAGAGAKLPSKQDAVLPYPTRSIVLAERGQLPLRAVELFTSATFPAVALILIPVFVASAAGNALPTLPPEASLTRMYPPGAIEPVKVAALHDVPAAEAYCTDQPFILTALVVGLYNSTKSLR